MSHARIHVISAASIVAILVAVLATSRPALATGIVIRGEVSAPTIPEPVRSIFSYSNDPIIMNNSSGNYTLHVADDGYSAQGETSAIIGASDTADAQARVSIASGQLGIYASATGGGASGALASFSDRIFLHGTPAGGVGTPVHFDIHLEGSAVADDPSYFLQNSALQISWQANNGFGGSGGNQRFPLSPGNYTVNFTVPTSGVANPLFDIVMSLFTNSGGTDSLQNGKADFFDTATLSMTLAPNVTYTSASGVFLTQPVPEPTSGTEMLLLAASATPLSRRLRPRRC